jgi:hypothetical protein
MCGEAHAGGVHATRSQKKRENERERKRERANGDHYTAQSPPPPLLFVNPIIETQSTGVHSCVCIVLSGLREICYNLMCVWKARDKNKKEKKKKSKNSLMMMMMVVDDGERMEDVHDNVM